MSKPTRTTHLGVEHVPDPLDQLVELGSWLDDPARRHAWRTARKARNAALIDAEREHFAAGLTSRRSPAATIADLHEQVEQAQGRAGLLALAEELAERTRLRVTATINRPGPDGQADTQTLRLLAARITTGIRQLVADLADADHVHPDEAHRNAESALGELTSRHRSVEATGEPDSLRGWADAVEFALTVVETAATRA